MNHILKDKAIKDTERIFQPELLNFIKIQNTDVFKRWSKLVSTSGRIDCDKNDEWKYVDHVLKDRGIKMHAVWRESKLYEHFRTHIIVE